MRCVSHSLHLGAMWPLVCAAALLTCSLGPAVAQAKTPPPAEKPAQASKSAACATDAAVEPFDLYYGIYVGGQKVGWMHSALTLVPRPRLNLQLRARVSGLGQASDITMDERREYDGPCGLLRELYFAQGAATGRVQVRGARRGTDFVLDIAAGGQEKQQSLQVAERLQDATALYRLGKTGKVGSTLHTAHLDPSMQQVLPVDYTVDTEQTRVLAGVPTRTLQVTARYPELGVSETSWLDATGKLLESRIGGFFVARLEAPEVAKKLDYSQDVLISAVVPVTTPLQAPQQLDKLEVSFTGFDGLQPPHSARQKVTQEGNITHLVLTRDPEPAADLLGHAAQDPNLPAEVRQALAATPFVQSDAPVLVRAARRAIGPVTDVFAASSRLQHFVFTYLHSEYVPAFSNALEAFNSRRGDCTEHSVLFVALARAVQIPARVAVGVAYWPPGRGFGWHAWAEIWVDGRWVVVDPTWDQPIADATHIKLADGGPAEQARIVMLLGQLKVTALQAQPQ